MLKQLKVRSSIRDRDQEPWENKQRFHISLQSSGVSSHRQPLKIRTLLRELKDGWKNTQDLWRGKKINIYIYYMIIRSEDTTANPKHLWANHWFAIPNHFSARILHLLSYLIFSEGIPQTIRKDLSSCVPWALLSTEGLCKMLTN